MKNKLFIIVIAILALAASAIWYFAVYSVKQESVETNKTSNENTVKTQEKQNNSYANLKGDAFDEAYIAGMLAHHEGAVNMAEQAMGATAHDEIRTLAGNIMQTQSMEIMQMLTWQKEWNYNATVSGGHNSHAGTGTDMAGDMVEMQNKLQGLSGESYDKEFLIQMILHHEQAVEMSQSAAINANHQEIKDLAAAVIKAQTAEIVQMKQWQKEWGY